MTTSVLSRPPLFGNVQRARVSSQCWKRAVRELMQEEEPVQLSGQRTRLILDPLYQLLPEKLGFGEEEARRGAEARAGRLDRERRCPAGRSEDGVLSARSPACNLLYRQVQ